MNGKKFKPNPNECQLPQQSRRKKSGIPSSSAAVFRLHDNFQCRAWSMEWIPLSVVDGGRNQFRTSTFKMMCNQNTLPTILYIWYQQHPTQINCIWLKNA